MSKFSFDNNFRYIEDICYEPSHTLRICLEPDFDDTECGLVTFYIKLTNHNSFFKRLWIGIKYIFGHDSKYQYDIIEFDSKRVVQLQRFLEEFQNATKRVKN